MQNGIKNLMEQPEGLNFQHLVLSFFEQLFSNTIFWVLSLNVCFYAKGIGNGFCHEKINLAY